MKKILTLCWILLLVTDCITAQTLLKTQDYGSSQIIIPFEDNYFIYQKGRTLNEYNSNHEFVKSVLALDLINPHILSNNGTIAVIEGVVDQCDVFPKAAFLVLIKQVK